MCQRHSDGYFSKKFFRKFFPGKKMIVILMGRIILALTIYKATIMFKQVVLLLLAFVLPSCVLVPSAEFPVRVAVARYIDGDPLVAYNVVEAVREIREYVRDDDEAPVEELRRRVEYVIPWEDMTLSRQLLLGVLLDVVQENLMREGVTRSVKVRDILDIVEFQAGIYLSDALPIRNKFDV